MTLPLGPFFSPRSIPETAESLIGILYDYAPKIADRYRAELVAKKSKVGLVYLLLKRLGRYAPPFAYVGPHPTNESQLGVWIDLGKLHAAEEKGVLIQAMDDTVKTKARYVLVLGHHVVLYHRKNWERVWEVE